MTRRITAVLYDTKWVVGSSALLRVTPSVYTMRDEVDLFADLMLQAAKKGIAS